MSLLVHSELFKYLRVQMEHGRRRVQRSRYERIGNDCFLHADGSRRVWHAEHDFTACKDNIRKVQSCLRKNQNSHEVTLRWARNV